MKLLPIFSISAFALLLIGCASTPITDLQTVGPQHPARQGTLVVYSATEEHNDGDVHYYPHTSYELYSQAGKHLRNVRNHIGPADEAPAAVPLPPGKYAIIAESEAQGLVRVPVEIADGLSTVVDLEKPGRTRSVW